VMLGLVGFSFTEGISTIWIIPGCIAGYLYIWIFIAPKMRKISHSSNAVTLPDFLVSGVESFKMTNVNQA